MKKKRMLQQQLRKLGHGGSSYDGLFISIRKGMVDSLAYRYPGQRRIWGVDLLSSKSPKYNYDFYTLEMPQVDNIFQCALNIPNSTPDFGSLRRHWICL